MMCFSMLQLPLKVLKNTRKKTMNHAVTTFEARPSPKIMVINGTNAIRGSELQPVMIGFSTRATRGFCESRRPKPKPLATDTTNPMVVASMVDHRCGQINPADSPRVHSYSRYTTMDGRLMKKG